MNIEQILKNAGCSVTKERKDIFSFIETKHIFSYNDILENFKNIGRASVFRTINLFLKLGIIRKVNIGDRIENYELIDESDYHHEHLMCEKCNCVMNFDSKNICKKILKEAKKLGFEVKNHNIGVYGLCKNCI